MLEVVEEEMDAGEGQEREQQPMVTEPVHHAQRRLRALGVEEGWVIETFDVARSTGAVEARQATRSRANSPLSGMRCAD